MAEIESRTGTTVTLYLENGESIPQEFLGWIADGVPMWDPETGESRVWLKVEECLDVQER